MLKSAILIKLNKIRIALLHATEQILMTNIINMLDSNNWEKEIINIST